APAGRYAVSETFDPPTTGYSYATHACVVEADPETGQVEVLRYAVAEDCGTAINPMIADGQVHGGVAHGIGESRYEAVLYGAGGRGEPDRHREDDVESRCRRRPDGFVDPDRERHGHRRRGQPTAPAYVGAGRGEPDRSRRRRRYARGGSAGRRAEGDRRGR